MREPTLRADVARRTASVLHPQFECYTPQATAVPSHGLQPFGLQSRPLQRQNWKIERYSRLLYRRIVQRLEEDNQYGGRVILGSSYRYPLRPIEYGPTWAAKLR